MAQEQPKVYRRRKIRKTGGDGDMISALPDETLQHVLSFLPSREAVQTCVLARRWRHLWRAIPALRINAGDRCQGVTEQEFSKLTSFLDNLLLLRDRGAPLDLCEFRIGELKPNKDTPQFSFWVEQALLCKAQILRLEYFDSHDSTLMLQDWPLISQNLTTLELTSVRLRRESLNFSNCLSLRNLLMRACCIDAKKVSSPSIKKLTMIECSFGYCQNIRTRVSAPGLVWLELTDNYDKMPLLEKMQSLVKAFIRLNGCDNCSDDGDVSGDCVLLKALSMAENLELVIEPGMVNFIFERDLMWRPTFSKLRTLLLNEWCVENDFRALICFLQLTPVLEKLTLQLCEARDNWMLPKGFDVSPEAPIASGKLRVVEIKCQEFDERVHQISRFFSIYNGYLEQINIQWTWRSSEHYSFQTERWVFPH